MPPQNPRILLVDDQVEVLETFAGLLEDDFQVELASSGEEALATLRRATFEVVVTDIKMPGMSGVELARAITSSYPLTEVVVMTAAPDVDTALEALHIGVVDYLRKPFRVGELRNAIERARIKQRMLQSMAIQSGDVVDVADAHFPPGPKPMPGFERLRGESPPMKHLRNVMRRVLHTDTTTLILGETGAGKEVVARALHDGGHRSAKPFFAVNCATFSQELLESELFGYAAGAFTGATKDKPGLIEQANDGTVFLDEIGEMPIDLQAKLLRTLQEQEVRRIGDAKSRRVNVRFLAATNRNLEDEVRAGRFRRDLYYRLNVFPIRVPPLRDRPADVPGLLRHFLTDLGQAQGRPALQVAPDVARVLAARSWPGNVRELRNLAERLVLLTEGETVGVAELNQADALDAPASTAPPASNLMPAVPAASDDRPAASPGSISGNFSLADLEAVYIQQVLTECEGNKAEAARRLGIHLSTLYRKLG